MPAARVPASEGVIQWGSGFRVGLDGVIEAADVTSNLVFGGV
jgi:hypothetical protein